MNFDLPRSPRPADNFVHQESGATPAFLRFLMGDFARGGIFVLADSFGQSAIYQGIAFEAKFLTPGPVLGLRRDHFLQAIRRQVFGQLAWHWFYID